MQDKAFLARLETGGVVIFVGPPRLGKTSLLLRAKATLLEQERRVALFVLKTAKVASTREFVRRFVAALHREAKLSRGAVGTMPSEGSVLDFFGAELRAFASNAPGGPAVLLLDDIEDIAEVEDAREVLDTLDAVQRETGFTLVLTGTRHPLRDAPGYDARFAGARPFDLPDFSLADLAGLSARFGDAYVRQVFQLTQGHPYLTMCLLLAHEGGHVGSEEVLSVERAADLIFFAASASVGYQGTPSQLVEVVHKDFEHRPVRDRVDALIVYRALMNGQAEALQARVPGLVAEDSPPVLALVEHGLVASPATLRARDADGAWKLEGRNPILDYVFGGKAALPSRRRAAWRSVEWGKLVEHRPHLQLVYEWGTAGVLPAGELGERVAQWLEGRSAKLSIAEAAFRRVLSKELQRARRGRWGVGLMAAFFVLVGVGAVVGTKLAAAEAEAEAAKAEKAKAAEAEAKAAEAEAKAAEAEAEAEKAKAKAEAEAAEAEAELSGRLGAATSDLDRAKAELKRVERDATKSKKEHEEALAAARAKVESAEAVEKAAMAALNAMQQAQNRAKEALEARKQGHQGCISAMETQLDGGVSEKLRLDAVVRALECQERVHQDGGSAEVRSTVSSVLKALRPLTVTTVVASPTTSNTAVPEAAAPVPDAAPPAPDAASPSPPKPGSNDP
ncbi:MAG: AAA family ATPase [Myxococcales bacterium]|nr:AAA family ATPase [Myxococcales bacterium]